MEICDFAFHQPSTLAEACELGRKYGVEYAEAFHYIGRRAPGSPTPVEEYVEKNAVPLR